MEHLATLSFCPLAILQSQCLAFTGSAILRLPSLPPSVLSLSVHRNVSDPRGQGLGRRPRRRHGHHQRRGRPLRSRGQEGVLHLDIGRSGGGKERGEEEEEEEKEEERRGEERRGKNKPPPFIFTTLQFFTQSEGGWEGKGRERTVGRVKR